MTGPNHQHGDLGSVCECHVADLTVDTGYVGDWYVQVLACKGCAEIVETYINHAAECEGFAELEVPADG